MVLFIEYKDDTWIAKPDRPFGKLQLDLYDSAFRINEEMFSCPIEREVMEDRTYVSKRSWSNLTDKIEAMSLEEMEKVVRERQEAVKTLMDYALSFQANPEGISKAFEFYERMISFFHFRWNFGKAVEKRLETQLAQLQPKNRLKAMKLVSDVPQIETVVSMKDFHDLIETVRENPDYRNMFSSLNGQLLPEVKKISELWKRISLLAEEYMHVHNEDMRLEAPYLYVVEHVRNNLEKGSDFAVPKKSPVRDIDDLKAHVKDWNVFQRYIMLAVTQGIHRENEHHLQIRGQNRMKRKLDALAQALVVKGELKDYSQLYECGKSQVLQLAGRVNSGELCYDR